MKTVVVQIGNSDDRLAQKQWSDFCAEIDRHLHANSRAIHFRGTSDGAAQWQNACWVISVEDGKVLELLAEVAIIRENYDQDSAAVLVGDIEFV